MAISFVFDGLPAVELRPNYHKSNYWFGRAAFSRQARQDAYMLGLSRVSWLRDFVAIEYCEVTEVFTVPTLRGVDVEGLMAACKPWIDGLVDAGVIVDDDWQHVRKLTGLVRYSKGREATEIIVSGVMA